MLRKSARISRITFSSSTTRMRGVSAWSTNSTASDRGAVAAPMGVETETAEASGEEATESSRAGASASRASRSLVLKKSPLFGSIPNSGPKSRPGPGRSPALKAAVRLPRKGLRLPRLGLHLALLRNQILVLLLAILRLGLLRGGVALGVFPVLVGLLPLALVVSDREIAVGFDLLLVGELGLLEFDLGLGGHPVSGGRLPDRLQPIALLIQPIELQLRGLHAHLRDLLGVAGSVGAVLVPRLHGGLTLGDRLLYLQIGLLLLFLGDVPIVLEELELLVRVALLA